MSEISTGEIGINFTAGNVASPTIETGNVISTEAGNFVASAEPAVITEAGNIVPANVTAEASAGAGGVVATNVSELAVSVPGAQENGSKVAGQPEAIQDNPDYKAFMDNPQTGFDARLRNSFSSPELPTKEQLDAQAKAVRVQMEQEFAAQHPDIWKKFYPTQAENQLQNGENPKNDQQKKAEDFQAKDLDVVETRFKNLEEKLNTLRVENEQLKQEMTHLNSAMKEILPTIKALLEAEQTREQEPAKKENLAKLLLALSAIAGYFVFEESTEKIIQKGT